MKENEVKTMDQKARRAGETRGVTVVRCPNRDMRLCERGCEVGQCVLLRSVAERR